MIHIHSKTVKVTLQITDNRYLILTSVKTYCNSIMTISLIGMLIT